jgi:nitrogen-specific signal transduction histidine kinase
MDRAPLQEGDIHDSIEDTLTIMRHKLKYGITVIRDYDRALPRLAV